MALLQDISVTDTVLRGIMHASPVGIVVFDHNARAIFANDLAEQLFGNSVDAVIGNRCGDFIACQHRHSDPRGCGHSEHCSTCPFFKAIQAVLEGNTDPDVAKGEALVQREADQPPIWLKFKASGIVLDGHKAVVMAMDDITEMKRAEATLQESERLFKRMLIKTPKPYQSLDRQGQFQQTRCIFQDITDRRPAEEALWESEKKYRKIFENAPVGIFQTTPQGRFLSVNPEYARMAGYSSPAEMIEQVSDIAAQLYVRPEERERYKELLQRHGQVRHYEVELKRRDGSPFWASMNSKALENPDGSFVYDGFLTEITERVRAEQALRKQNNFIQTILDNLPIGLAVNYFEDGTTTYINSAFEKIYGWPKEELKDVRSFFEKIYPDPRYRDEIQKQFQNDMASGDPERMHWENVQVTAKDGSKRIVIAKNIPLVEQNVMISTVQDITESKRAEASLRESEERFQKAFISSPAPLVIAEIDTGRFIDVNDRWVQMIGYSREEQIGRTSTELEIWVNPDDRDLFVRKLDALGHFKDEPVEFRNKTGGIVHALWSAELVTLAGRQVILGMLYDESERKTNEKERIKLQQQLTQAQKMESIGRLAGGVAHDYNNMLSIILGYTEMLTEKVPPQSPLHADLMEILKAAQRSADITRQLLAFARKQTINPKVIDLNAVVESMLRMLRRLIGEDIDLAWLPGKQLWTIKIDPSQIDQILANLCVNARDAIAGVGKVTIETGNITIDNAYCDMHTGFVPGEFLMLAVSDNGCGMDEEIKENIFEPFFTTKGLTEGTGLGLATVYGIVKQNDGFINVYSEPGEGTTFRIYLPRHVGDEPRMIGATKTQTPEGNGETVLLVEDEPSIMRMAEIMLKRLGYQVLAAGTPSQALSLAAGHAGAIDLLITDVVMPEMSGRKLDNQIHALYPSIKTLFMSGYTANVIAHNGILDEGVNFIQKPFSLNELGIKVRMVLVEK